MSTSLRDDEVDLEALSPRRVAVVGTSFMAVAHAACLRDSGVHVALSLIDPTSDAEDEALSLGLNVDHLEDALEDSDVVAIIAPAHRQVDIMSLGVADSLVVGDLLVLSDPTAVVHGRIQAPAGVDVALISCLGSAHELIDTHSVGQGLRTLLAVNRDCSGQAWDVLLGYAKALGSLRAGAVRTTFTEAETVQRLLIDGVLGGALPRILERSFEGLVNGGCQARVAAMVSTHILEQITAPVEGLLTERGEASVWAANVYANALNPALDTAITGSITAIRTGQEMTEPVEVKASAATVSPEVSAEATTPTNPIAEQETQVPQQRRPGPWRTLVNRVAKAAGRSTHGKSDRLP